MYLSLFAGYAAAAAVLLAVAIRWKEEWPDTPAEPGWPLIRVIGLLAGVLIIGYLYRAGWLIPSSQHPLLARMGNQLLIFGPVFAAAAFAASRGTAWSRRVAFMPTARVCPRILVGIGAAIVALVAHQLVAGRIHLLGATIAELSRGEHMSHAVQILGEDIAIAMLFAALLRRIRARYAAIGTGLLFALGHVPAMVAGGDAPAEFLRLVADGVLAASVVALLFRLRDVWPFWPVHVAMDLTQFLTVTP